MKKTSIKLLVLITFFIVISLSACLGDWHGDLAKLVISLGNENRAVYDPNDSETHQKLEHEIVLTNVTETLNFSFSGVSTFEVNVAPGNWNISVVSYLDEDVYAAGSKDVILKLGLNNETINMYQAHLVKFVANSENLVPDQIIFHGMRAKDPGDMEDLGERQFIGWFNKSDECFEFEEKQIFESITLYAKWEAPIVSVLDFDSDSDIIDLLTYTLADKLEWLQANAVDGGNYIIEVVNTGDGGEINPKILEYDEKNVTITLKSFKENEIISIVTLSDSEEGSLFTIGPHVTLILENIILQGHDNNNSPLVYVKGKLIMNIGATIRDNTSTGENNGGGVCVGDGGYFLMNGGDITNNTVKKNGGAGVNIYPTGTFTMKGGKITNNTAEKDGSDTSGGVAGSGVFNMEDGEISGNITQGSGGGVNILRGTFTMTGGIIKNNYAKRGGGVNVGGGGTFTMSGGTISGNIVTWRGGGVNVNEGTFIKNGGGTIFGDSDSNTNILIENQNGIAVFINGTVTDNMAPLNNDKYRNKTAGPKVNLDSNKNGSTGGWDN